MSGTDKTHLRGFIQTEGGNMDTWSILLHACINTVLVSEFADYYSAVTPHRLAYRVHAGPMPSCCSLSAKHVAAKSCS